MSNVKVTRTVTKTENGQTVEFRLFEHTGPRGTYTETRHTVEKITNGDESNRKELYTGAGADAKDTAETVFDFYAVD